MTFLASFSCSIRYLPPSAFVLRSFPFFSLRTELLVTKWREKKLDVKRLVSVLGFLCSLFGAKACTLGQNLPTLRVIY